MCCAYCFGWNPGLKFPRFQLALNNIFCPNPPHFIHRRLNHHQRTKISKTMLSVSPSSVFQTKFTVSKGKSKYFRVSNKRWGTLIFIKTFSNPDTPLPLYPPPPALIRTPPVLSSFLICESNLQAVYRKKILIN